MRFSFVSSRFDGVEIHHRTRSSRKHGGKWTWKKRKSSDRQQETTTSVGICGTGRVAGRRPGSKSPTPLVGYVIRRGVPAEAKRSSRNARNYLACLTMSLRAWIRSLAFCSVDLEDFLVAECMEIWCGLRQGSSRSLPAAVMACQEAYARFGLDGAAGGGNRGILLWSGVGRTGCDGEPACLSADSRCRWWRSPCRRTQSSNSSVSSWSDFHSSGL